MLPGVDRLLAFRGRAQMFWVRGLFASDGGEGRTPIFTSHQQPHRSKVLLQKILLLWSQQGNKRGSSVSAHVCASLFLLSAPPGRLFSI